MFRPGAMARDGSFQAKVESGNWSRASRKWSFLALESGQPGMFCLEKAPDSNTRRSELSMPAEGPSGSILC